MKLLLAAFVLSLSSLTHANDLIKLLDGSVARCESRIDVARHNITGVYRPVSVVREGEMAEIRIEFLRCVESKTKFGFEREAEIEARSVRPVMTPERELLVERSKISLVVMNGKGELVDRQEMSKGLNGLYIVRVKTEGRDYDDSPEGKKSLEIHVQANYKITDTETGNVIDQGRDAYGSYRLIVK